MTNNFLKVALLVSISAHSLLIFGVPNTLSKEKVSERQLYIAYIQAKQIQADIIKERQSLFKYSIANIGEDKQALDKIEIKKTSGHKPETKPIEKKVSKVKIDKKDKKVSYSKKIKSASQKEAYINYYQMLRDRIKLFAKRNYPSKKVEGQVMLSFVLFNDGRLKSADILDDRSSIDVQLRIAAIDSISQAAPFAAFPKQLQALGVSELTFNIVISFELQDGE